MITLETVDNMAGMVAIVPNAGSRVAGLRTIRKDLRKLRLAILSGEVIPVEHHREVVGYFLNPASVGLEGERVENVSLRDFRKDITLYWEKLVGRECDAVLITRGQNKIPAIAFVSVELYQSLEPDPD